MKRSLATLVLVGSVGAFWACGGGIIVEGEDTPTRDAGPSDARTDGRTGREPVPEPLPPENAICPSPAPTSDPPYKSAKARQQVCGADIGTFIESYIQANSSATFKDLENAIAANGPIGGAACASCVFTKENDSAWGPIVYRGDGASGDAFFNYGACFERAPGGSAACGKTIQSTEACLDFTCSDEDCGSENAKQACIQASLQDTSTGCGRYDVQGACGMNLNSLNQSCSTGIEVIEIMCAKTGLDGG